MKYKGYFGQVTYDDEAKIFHGEIQGIRAIIIFQGKSVEELEKAFKDSVDDYLDWCKERGEEPEKAFSGKVLVRLTPGLHSKLARVAMKRGLSLNNLLNEELKKVE